MAESLAARFAAAALALALASCASSGAPQVSTPANVARTAPDDGDLWNLAPAGAVSIADVDMAALARSPWSRSLVTGGLAEDRDGRLKTFGYDLFADVDRMLVAGTEGQGGPESITVARGRFDATRVGLSFSEATPGATTTRWRDSPLWEGGGRAVALVTPRTLVQGSPAAVRAAIDCAWGVVPDARGGALGALRRGLDAENVPAAVVVALLVTPQARDRAAGFVEVPPGLRKLGARLDLGRDLELRARAVLDGAAEAAAAHDTWGRALSELARQRMLKILGLGPLIEGARLELRGPEVHGLLHIGEERREALSQRLLFLLQTLVKQRREAASVVEEPARTSS